MTFRTQIHKKKFGIKCFRTLQGTMSHRPLTNTSSLKIAAAYCTCLFLIFCILHICIPTALYPRIYGETVGKRGRCVLSVSTPLIRTREMAAMFICSTYEHSLPPSGFCSLPRVFVKHSLLDPDAGGT
jgi:hypothetical protein